MMRCLAMCAVFAAIAATSSINVSLRTLNILIVGGLYDDPDGAIERLRRELRARRFLVDVVLCTGDLTSMLNSRPSPLAPSVGKKRSAAQKKAAEEAAVTAEYMRRALEVVDRLKQLAPLVYYVPGVHDPLPLYQTGGFSGQAASAMARDAHGVVEELTRALWIGGWGGAPAAGDAIGAATPSSAEGAAPAQSPSARSYPWAEAELKKAQKGLREAFARVPPGDSAIVLSHAGPDGVGTTLLGGALDADVAEAAVAAASAEAAALLEAGSRLAPAVETATQFVSVSSSSSSSSSSSGTHSASARGATTRGSGAIRDLLAPKKAQQRTVLFVHGRPASGVGLAQLGAVTVVNPGSLARGGTYALVELRERPTSGWRFLIFH